MPISIDWLCLYVCAVNVCLGCVQVFIISPVYGTPFRYHTNRITVVDHHLQATILKMTSINYFSFTLVHNSTVTPKKIAPNILHGVFVSEAIKQPNRFGETKHFIDQRGLCLHFIGFWHMLVVLRCLLILFCYSLSCLTSI